MHVIGQLVRGGAERQLVYLAKALHNEGWPQVVVTFNPGDVLEKELMDSGILIRGIARMKNKFARLWQLQRVVNTEMPAIVHSWSNFTNVYIRWLSHKDSAPLKIASVRENPRIDYNGNPVKHVPFSGIYKKMDCVISNSQAIIDVVRASGIILPRVETVANFLAPQGQANPGTHTDKPIIVAVGALTKLKAFDVLLYALHEISKRGFSFKLLLAGDGPEYSTLRNLTETLGLKDQIELLGDVEDIPSLLQSSHIFVHPSRSESLCNAILEALGAGLPVIAGNVGGNPELIENLETGILVPVDDSMALANAIEILIKEPELRKQLGENASLMIKQRHSIHNVSEQYKRIYSSLLGIG